MGYFGSDQPDARDYPQETRETLENQIELAGPQYESEARYQPLYADLAAQNINRILSGRGTEPGLFQLMQEQNTRQRAADVGDVAALGPKSREAILASNPDQAELLRLLNEQAVGGLESGDQFTTEQERELQRQAVQAARSRGSRAGTIGTNQGVADELLQQFNLGQALQAQRRQFAGNVLGYNQAVVGDPFQQILSRPGTSIGQGQMALGQAGPSLFNPESSYAGNLYNANEQMSALFAEPSTMAKVGAVGNAVGSAVGAIAKGVAMCWAAREIFGTERDRMGNLIWLQFRNWLLLKSPEKLRKWYGLRGEDWAERLKQASPGARAAVRRWMERRITL